MLVLTRKLGEGIVFGHEVTLKILEIHKNQIKLGIEAPQDVRIYRDEVYRQIKEENLKASMAQKSDIESVVDNLNQLLGKNLSKEVDGTG